VAETQKPNTSLGLFWVSVVMIVLMGGVMAVFWNKLPPQLPWFYSFPTGEKQLVSKLWFVWIFLGMGVVLFLSRIIAKWAGKEDETIRNTIMVGIFAAVVLMVASFIRIMMIFLNT
jgi:hypothetical protein